MRRSTVVAGILTVGLHVVALGLLSLWAVGGGDRAQALEMSVRPGIMPGPSRDPSLRPDTASQPVILPGRGVHADQGTEVARPESSLVKADSRPPARTEITPVMILSWKQGGVRRKTAGRLPTLQGPLAGDVSASFKVMVAPDGKVRSVRAATGKDAAFERAAIARIRQWTFEPLRAAGRASDQLCTVTLKAKAR